MPFKDKNKRRKYMKNYMRKRRRINNGLFNRLFGMLRKQGHSNLVKPIEEPKTEEPKTEKQRDDVVIRIVCRI